ncbi:protein downstream neighbor of Son-like isoform X4 [Phoenix dactylifera]|uniref:Protein downstream neighbor of Son-like isoform X4 n=1 Tax=Phoenix dactylifera TaxID=42345 RepID=A0A8B9A2V6_PHODC|nr:protein downstream neighbor of Son-like isoform X4 [Phoenix dactylifera]
MAKAAVVEPSSSNTLPFGRAQSDVKMKRKTPSELRGEQLKRRGGEMLAGWGLPPLLASDSGMNDGVKKPESLKIPKYIDTHVDDVYPVKKSSERCRVLYGKAKVAKDPSITNEMSNDLANLSAACSFPAKGMSLVSCGNAAPLKNSECPGQSAKDVSDQGFRKIEKCSQNALRNVVDLHLGNEKLADCASIDMEKALKGFVARDVPARSGLLADSSGRLGELLSNSSSTFRSEILMPGHRAPLDLTLKTTLRIVSSTSVKWCHRVGASPATIDISQFTQFSCHKDKKTGCTSGHSATAEILYSKALHSWAYPQSSLPPSIISAMASSAVKGEVDFLVKRQQDWEDSFQNLYYMLRKNMCNIFYVNTSQFVALFLGGNFLGKKKRSCSAFLSQSTSGLRSLLRQHDISFAMPLCHAEVEQAMDDELVELSEIEKQNFGQTFHMDSLSDVDNSPQSLLSFIGNEKVHGLYDFLLNHRYILKSFTGIDVPTLYAPVPFQNASLHVPEVRCKEMRKADMVVPSSSASDTEDAEAIPGLSAAGFCYSLEIKDTVIPPWIVSGLCSAMSSDFRSFESTFTNEPASVGLNAALDSVCHKSSVPGETDKPLLDSVDAFGIREAVLDPCLSAASLRRLKFSNGAYVAYIDPI